MFQARFQTLTDDHSLLLFGARGVGKSSLLESLFDLSQTLYINLLDPLEEERFSRHPNELIALVNALSKNTRYVIIDEIQKIPKLLDVIHLLIENEKSEKIFILTGSSARKLKAQGVNLLAGRAFVFYLFPFSYLELEKKFILEDALHFGMLPKILHLKTNRAKELYLRTYAQVYLKEEVWGEQLVKNLDPFRRFLEVAAQTNGKIINYANIAKDVGADEKTVKNYFSILEDTLLGIILEGYQHSFRKRLKHAPKFYFIDVGIARALARTLSVPPVESTSYYGELFEQFVIVECFKLINYFKPDYQLSYLQSESGLEIDLVVERPKQKTLLIEIKSSATVKQEDLNSLKKIYQDFPNAEAVCFSRDSRKKKFGDIIVYPWQIGIKEYFCD